MAELKAVIAKNISELRTSHKLTQLELAEKLHYSDKAVSKWERGESVPEIGTLIAMAELFGVTLDYLVSEEHEMPSETDKVEVNEGDKKRKTRNRAIISVMGILIVWFVALLVYVILNLVSGSIGVHWLAFVYAVPATVLLWLIFNSIWFCRRRNYLIISFLMWSILATFHITTLALGHNFWQIYLFGIPGQAAVILWSRLKFTKKK